MSRPDPSLLPDKPGVYLMKDDKGEIIYIGKAKSLRKRVRQYFAKKTSYKQGMLAQMIADIDFIIARDELEALILENNLIKKHKPYYNVLLKDDKTYPYLRLSLEEEYPTLTKVRKVKDDGARYFGPFPRAKHLNRAKEQLIISFGLRPCARMKKRPCLYSHIKKCEKICTGTVSKEVYAKRVEELISFITSYSIETVKNLQERMREAASKLDFEEAARLRDLLSALRLLWGKSEVEATDQQDVDYPGWEFSGSDMFFTVLAKRKGKVIRHHFSVIPVQEWEEQEDLYMRALVQYYEAVPDHPSIICFKEIPNRDLLEGLFLELFSRKVRVISGKREVHKKSLSIMKRNLSFRINDYRKSKEQKHKVLSDLADIFSLHAPPERIEGYDISTLAGELSVGSMVVFEKGLPENKQYRRFRIKTVEGVDDYSMMKEVLSRRMKHDDWPKPDLILIDGGKGQLNAAAQILAQAGYNGPLLSIAKKEELIFSINLELPVKIPHNHPVLQLLIHVRDEAHRFAITFQRASRKRKFKSVLDDIPGLGPKRRAMLEQFFPNTAVLSQASAEEIAKVPGISLDLAKRIITRVTKTG